MTRKRNEKNTRIKRRYTQYLEEAKRLSEASTDKALAAIDRFEASTGGKDFAAFHIEQAIAFKRALAKETNPKTRRPLASGTINSILKALRSFVLWLADQPGYKKRITYSDADYFNASNREQRLAREADQRPSPSLKQIEHVLKSMQVGTAIERRDRAIIAFLILTGIRDGAVVDLKIRHVDIANRTVRQDARDVRTKFSKTMTTDFFPVGMSCAEIVGDWLHYLRDDQLFSPDDPLFPKTRIAVGPTGSFMPIGLKRAHWATAASLRKIVSGAFRSQDMEGYGPHSFRKTLARLGQQICKTPEELKAWSQNLGHEDVMTTLMSYGRVSIERQRSLLEGMVDR